MRLKKYTVNGKHVVEAGTPGSAARKVYGRSPRHHTEECEEGTPNSARVEDEDGKVVWCVEVENG